MKNILLLCFIILICLGSISAQERITSETPLPIMAWAGISDIESNIDKFNELKEMGINVNLSNYPNATPMQQAFDLAQLAGIKMVTSSPELKTDLENMVKRFLNHPDLLGYFLRDMPVRKDFADLDDLAKKISAIDSKHFCFVNQISSINTTKTDALGTASYAEYVSTFAKEVPAKLLSFDFYSILTLGIHESW